MSEWTVEYEASVFLARMDNVALRDEARVHAENLAENGWTGAARRIRVLTEALIQSRADGADGS